MYPSVSKRLYINVYLQRLLEINTYRNIIRITPAPNPLTTNFVKSQPQSLSLSLSADVKRTDGRFSATQNVVRREKGFNSFGPIGYKQSSTEAKLCNKQ